MRNTYEGLVALVGVILAIALMSNPLLTGYALVKLIELALVMVVVNMITRFFTGKSLVELLRSL